MGGNSIEKAILDVLGSERYSYWMPSSIVGRLRERFDPAGVRPTLEDMHRRRLVALHGYAYCLPEFVEGIRNSHLTDLQSEYGTEKWNSVEGGAKRFEDVWEAVERWDGFGEREPLLGVFKTIRLPASRRREAQSNVYQLRPTPPGEPQRKPIGPDADFFESVFGPRAQPQKDETHIARVNWGSAPEGCTVKLFSINNSSGNTQFCLARDRKRAWEIAHCAGHVHWFGVREAGRQKNALIAAAMPMKSSGPWAWAQSISFGLSEVAGSATIGPQSRKPKPDVWRAPSTLKMAHYSSAR